MSLFWAPLFRILIFTDEIMSNIVPQTGVFDSMGEAVLISVPTMIHRIRSFYGWLVVLLHIKFYDWVIKWEGVKVDSHMFIVRV